MRAPDQHSKEIDMDTSTFKVCAQRLRAYLKQHRISLTHGQALDLVAAIAGLRNWPEVNAFPARVAAAACDNDACQRLASRIATRYGKTLSAQDLLKTLETPLPEKLRKRGEAQRTLIEGSALADGNVLRYEEVDGETGEATGRGASFVGVEFQALQYSDLINLKLDKVTIPLRWKNARVLKSTIPGITVEKFATGNATLESTYSSKTIGLVKGGWLPSGLAFQNDMVIMPDRCTITELIGRFSDGKKTNAADKDFLDFFANQHIRINPLLFALEGNLKKNPTPEVVEQQFEWACAKIKAALPQAELVPAGKESLRGVVGIINDTQAGMERKQDFLMRLAPKLLGNISALQLPAMWDDVLAIADECGVPRRSLVVLAALSAAAVPNGKSPAKKLLKLTKPNYSTELAYNALADLRSLEILMYLFALFPTERVLLCTGDKDLALFWAGIRASDFNWRGGYFQGKFSPVEALLPNVLPERMASYFNEEEAPRKLKAVAPRLMPAASEGLRPA